MKTLVIVTSHTHMNCLQALVDLLLLAADHEADGNSLEAETIGAEVVQLWHVHAEIWGVKELRLIDQVIRSIEIEGRSVEGIFCLMGFLQLVRQAEQRAKALAGLLVSTLHTN